jgi:trehalose 6-phosphate phosphatase
VTPPVRGCAYFFDLDGTLIHFAESPSQVEIEPALHRLVESLSIASAGAVSLITGRSLAEVDRLFPGRHLPAAGQHGLERRTATGDIERHEISLRPLHYPRRVLTKVVETHPSLLLEDKGLSLALHYRRAPRLAGVVHGIMNTLIHTMGTGYCLQRGKCVVELVPAGRNKGSAIAAFMREVPFRGRLPLFIGDDVTDEHGFAVVNRLGGYAIKVGAGRTVAPWRLPDVRAVLEWLDSGRPIPRPTKREAR